MKSLMKSSLQPKPKVPFFARQPVLIQLFWLSIFVFASSYQPQPFSDKDDFTTNQVVAHSFTTGSPPDFYEDEHMRFPMPKDWVGSKKAMGDRSIVVVLPPSVKAAPGFYLEMVPFQSIYSHKQLAKWLAEISGNASFQYKSMVEAGKVHLFELPSKGQKIIAATYFRRDFNHKRGYVGAFIAQEKNFTALNGEKAIQRVLDQIEAVNPEVDLDRKPAASSSADGTHASYAAGSATGQYHSSSMGNASGMTPQRFTASELIGRWTVGQIGGTIRQFNTSANQANQSLFDIHFRTNGTYQLRYHSTAVTGVFRSETDVAEQGSYRLTDTQLTLIPNGYKGWVYAGTAKNKQTVSDQNPPPRVYQTVAYPNGIGLVGDCAPFQVDAFCRSKSSNIIFGLKRK